MTLAVSGDSITFPDNSVQATAPKVGMVNRIINGAMVIDQRNAGASVANIAGGKYTLDRWNTYGSYASKFTVQQNAGSVTLPAGFTYYAGVTSSSAYTPTGTDEFDYYQIIEGYNIADLGWGTVNAKTVTLSFWVRSSLTGTFGGALQNNGSTRCYPFSYTISSANTWQQISIIVVGDTTGTWLTTNGVGLQVVFSMGAGSTLLGTAGSWAGTAYVGATGQTNLVATSGAAFYITGVQLEKGSTATSFDYRPYGTELGLCQRYLPALIADAGTTKMFAVGQVITSASAFYCVPFMVQPRVSPTGITVSSVSHFFVTNVSGGGVTPTSITFNNASLSAAEVDCATAAAGLAGAYTSGFFSSSASAKLLFTGCEL